MGKEFLKLSIFFMAMVCTLMCTFAPNTIAMGIPTHAAVPEQPFADLTAQEVKEGTGAQVKRGDDIQTHYRGILASNGKQFDSSYDRGEPLMFKIGAGEVIRGWDKGILGYKSIKGLRVGGKRILYIPANMAYGSHGAGDNIPPNSDLIFEVELVSILEDF